MTGCQWIEGEPGSPVCGAKKSPGRPYCPDHCVRAFIRKTRGGPEPFPRSHFLQPPRPMPWRTALAARVPE